MIIFIAFAIIVILIIAIIARSSGNSDCSENDSTDEDDNDTGLNSNKYNKTISYREERHVINERSSGIVTTTLSYIDKKYNFVELKPHPRLKKSYYYRVKGKNTKTNRLKTFEIYAYNNDDAIRRARLLGLTEPFTVILSEQNQPTERQLQAAKESEISIPPDATKDDISNIFARCWDDEPPITDETLNYVLNNDIVVSPYSSERRARANIERHKKLYTPN